MNEEEKKAIEYTENCLMKITMGIDCEFDVNILDALVNIIKKLQKENEEFKRLHIQDNKHLDFIMQHSITVQKVKDKIKEEKMPLTIVGGIRNKKILEYGISLGRMQVLQELIEEREEK